MALPVTGWRSRRRFRRRGGRREALSELLERGDEAVSQRGARREREQGVGVRGCVDVRSSCVPARPVGHARGRLCRPSRASVVVGKQRRVSGTRKRGSPRTERRRETNRRWRRARKTTTRAKDSRHVLARRLRPPRARPACPSAAVASTPGPARALRDGTPSPSASRARRSPVRRGRLHARTRARLARRDASLRASSQRLPHPRQGVVRTRRGRRRA